MNERRVRRMTEADLDAVVEVGGGGTREGWDRQAFADELASAVARPWVIELERELVGYLMTWRVADELQILHVAVRADQRRAGLAQDLLKHVLAHEDTDGATGATLEVRRSNVPARALYASLGFTVVGERRRYYQDGEDAVLMTLFIGAPYLAGPPSP